MAYEYEDKINEAFFKAGRDGRNVNRELLAELQEVYRKAKALDEVKNFTTERLKEEETTDEYDYGERFMCEEIKRLWEDE